MKHVIFIISLFLFSCGVQPAKEIQYVDRVKIDTLITNSTIVKKEKVYVPIYRTDIISKDSIVYKTDTVKEIEPVQYVELERKENVVDFSDAEKKISGKVRVMGVACDITVSDIYYTASKPDTVYLVKRSRFLNFIKSFFRF